jgi:hypothetical protein
MKTPPKLGGQKWTLVKSTFCLVNVIPNGQCAEVPNLDYDY